MKKIISLLLFLFLLSGCNKRNSEVSAIPELRNMKNETISTVERINTYAVITSVVTNDKDKYLNNIEEQASQLGSLWNQNIVENIYLDSKSGNSAPSVVFFIKAKNVNEAKSIIDETNFVKNRIGTYEIKAVGDLWLSINNKNQDLRSQKNSAYAVVWNYNRKIEDIPADLMQKQLGAEQKLFLAGILENAYLSTVNDGKKRTSSLYFINCNDGKEAKGVLDELPLTKQKIGNYKLYYVGNILKGKK